jgi:hypothetical protein
VLSVGGSIAACATVDPRPSIPFWDLLCKNARLLLLGSDDCAAFARSHGGDRPMFMPAAT